MDLRRGCGLKFSKGAAMGSSNRAAKQARADEQKRQARVAESTRRIDAAFDAPERQAQYDQYFGALRGLYRKDADRQKEVADRNLRFSLARSGLTGGSAAVDARNTLGEEYSRGILEAETRAQGGVADLRSADQATRLNLIQLANAGTDVTSAATNAAAAMRANLAAARGSNRTAALGDLFGQTSDIYRRQQLAAATRRGQLAPLGSYYSTRP